MKEGKKSKGRRKIEGKGKRERWLRNGKRKEGVKER